MRAGDCSVGNPWRPARNFRSAKLARLECLAINADGSPKYPLYLKARLLPIPLLGSRE